MWNQPTKMLPDSGEGQGLKHLIMDLVVSYLSMTNWTIDRVTREIRFRKFVSRMC